MTRIPQISYIIANLNGGDMLKKALQCIEEQTLQDFEVLVIDNASTDNSAELPCFKRERWKLIRLSSNKGFAAANNVGIGMAKGKYIALVNNDCFLKPTWAEHAVKAIESHERCGSVATRILQDSNPGLIDSAGFAFLPFGSCDAWRGNSAGMFSADNHSPTGAVATAALYRREALQQVGGFNETFFAYYEDTYLALRLNDAGWKCVYADNAVSHHVGSATGESRLSMRSYYLRRNVELLFFARHSIPSLIIWLAPHLLYELAAGLAMLAKGKASAFFKAKANALSMIPEIRRERAKVRAASASAGLKKDIIPRAAVAASLALTAAAAFFVPQPAALTDTPVKTELPEHIGEWRGRDIFFCHNFKCLATQTGPEWSSKPCPACGGELRSSWSPAESQMLPEGTLLVKKIYDREDCVLLVSIVVSGQERVGIHRPQMCLTGQGFSIAGESSETFSWQSDTVVMRHLQIGLPMMPGLSGHYYYWFTDGQEETDSHWKRLYIETAARLFGSNIPRWAYVSVAITPDTKKPQSADLDEFMLSLKKSVDKKAAAK